MDGHFGVLSIAGIFYPSAIRASGAGWATSVAKVGASLGPVGAVACALGIHFVTGPPAAAALQTQVLLS
jgi:AAHS family 4-hydroxybenzoate transporter-like MFS transporter